MATTTATEMMTRAMAKKEAVQSEAPKFKVFSQRAEAVSA
jgi:hypothetical protein